MKQISENDNNVIIFDTSFLISNAKSLGPIIKRINEKYICYIPQICIDEYISKTYLSRIEKIEKFKEDVTNYGELGIHFDNTNIQNKKIIKEKTNEFFKKIFDNKIICFHEYSLTKIVNRAYDKIPPFGESDTGFKDTLILLNIIDFINGKNKSKITFITNDKDFLDEQDIISKEILEKTKCVFDIVDGKNAIGRLYNYLKIDDEPEEISNYVEDNDALVKIDKTRNELNTVCNNIFYYEEYDEYGYDTHSENTFKINKNLELDEVKKFIEKIPVVLDNNIFLQQLNMSDFFDDFTMFSDEVKIKIEYFEQLISIYNLIKNNSHYKKAFLNYLLKKFEDCYDPFAGTIPSL